MSNLLVAPFLDRARDQPGATAVVQGSRRVTYGELEQRSFVLARHLVELGATPGDRIGIALGKSIEAVVAVLAVLRAGAAYVPLDEQSPPDRQLSVLADCAVRGLVATRRSRQRLGWGPSGPRLGHAAAGACPFVVELDREPAPATGGRGERGDPAQPENDEAAAYVLYTSGSTGAPKGVVMSHRAARAFVDWAVKRFELGPTDRIASVAELCFDLSVFDVFAGLAAGAEIHLVTPDLMLRPPRLVAWLDEARITSWYSVPSTLLLLLERGDLARRPPSALRRVLFAGEVFAVPQLRRAMQALPAARFFNLFGPTETNVCTYYALPPALPAEATAVPIGWPCDHAEVAVLDPEGRPVTQGSEGELCVGGAGVMSGYWGQSALTRAAFWPAGTVSGLGPLYRTGDRVRQGSDGQLWFLGRRDRQIKHRGYRIELGEVEAVVAGVPGVLESAVVTRPDPEQGAGLCAVVVPAPGEKVTVLAVKSHCGKVLPAYMVPSTVEVRDSLPRTSTGKVDWLRLR